MEVAHSAGGMCLLRSFKEVDAHVGADAVQLLQQQPQRQFVYGANKSQLSTKAINSGTYTSKVVLYESNQSIEL
eukprot:3602800-Amphidinium_carterae.1